MFMRDDFPAPLGPMMAVSCPEQHWPDIHFKIVLYPATDDNATTFSLITINTQYFHMVWYAFITVKKTIELINCTVQLNLALHALLLIYFKFCSLVVAMLMLFDCI